jgi:hypothetical protein
MFLLLRIIAPYRSACYPKASELSIVPVVLCTSLGGILMSTSKLFWSAKAAAILSGES